ncbi:hypothetical protein [Phaeobacter gallaeciensis]|uniref:hypothetical protein n=1 Tax=Phaeobacter gallaeciensis TaxID=60890 RepID=UPI00237F3ABD|nr:hypothetical protein [Phaeobacter gallaeciensis]MDE4059769.1 hypothetical protein [Phaeobacter gallaeciensis]MDE4122594.1 hypothetical protein [Phaeobacter gallaeciensis]MDE4127257.1 hypothetical protein [Phaeobacter gallaeciensis]
MKVVGGKKLARQLGALPEVTRGHVVKAISRSTEEGARVARTLAPDATGETREGITTEYRDGGMTGEVVVVSSDAPRSEKDKRYSIEHGRKRGSRGTTQGYHFVHRTKQYLGKKNRARIKRAINKAVKEVAGRG